MRVALFCGDRLGAYLALKSMLTNGVNVVACVFEEPTPNQLSKLCSENHIASYNAQKMYQALQNGSFPNFDWGISYLYHKILKKEIIDFANGKIINFHPAPTDVHRGVAACCYCILKDYRYWAVTAHYITTGIDDGDIIAQKVFPLEGIETGVDAEAFIQKQSVALFNEVLIKLLSGEEIVGTPQKVFEGVYYSRARLEQDKKIDLSDDISTIIKKLRAFWFPPYDGAYIEIDGEKFTLVDRYLLNKLEQ